MEYIKDGRLSESSRKLYNKKLDQYVSFMPDDNKSIGFIVDNPGIAVNILLNEENVKQTATNRHLFYSSVVAYIKHTEEGRRRSDRIKRKWEEIQKSNWEERRLLDLGGELSDKDKEIMTAVKWTDIIAMRDKLVAGSNEKLLLSLYTYLPPVRADYFEVRINPPASIVNDKKKSYIQIGETGATSELVIRDFKTSSTYKEIRHKLPEELFQEIIVSLGLKPRRYLFVMPSDETKPYDRGGFSKWANKVLHELFKVPMTITSIRHIFITTIDFTKVRAIELDKIARAMGHGLAMQKGYQWTDSTA